MHTLTIDGIDDALEQEITIRAKAFGLSRTETVKKILADTLLVREEAEPYEPKGNQISGGIDAKRKMFEPFCGIWTTRDAAEFEEATKDLNTINPGDWE